MIDKKDTILFSAPMAEITTPALRKTIKQFKSNVILYSEMLSAGAIVAGSAHNEPLVKLYDFDSPIIYQIVGENAHKMAKACEILSKQNCNGIDINMGCPAPDIIKKGCGSKLLLDFDKSKNIIRECRKTTDKTLSVKMRIGFDNQDEDTFISFIKMMENEGVDYITVHPRHAKLFFSRTSNWEFVKIAKKNVSIPIIGNGDITTPEIAYNRLTENKCNGLMIGRESIKSPWIFQAIESLIENNEYNFDVNLREIFTDTLKNLEIMLPSNLHKSRSHRFASYFSKNIKFGHQLFTNIRKEEKIDNIIQIIESYFERNPNEIIKNISGKL